MKICVVGPQNTGKTTFINDVISKYPELQKPSRTYRDIVKERGVEEQINQETTEATQLIILDAILQEMSEAEPNTIHDRCSLCALVYTLWAQLNNEEFNLDGASVCSYVNMSYDGVNDVDLIFYIPCDDSIPIEEREMRDTDKRYQSEIDLLYGDVLGIEEIFYKVVPISGSREERVDQFSRVYDWHKKG